MTRFEGFSAEAFRFLADLKRNNRRDWFLERKSTYLREVRDPMEHFVEAIGARLEGFAPEFVANPRTSVYRIYRDTRFSADKSPYKPHVAALFPHRELGKHQGAGFYVHVAPDDVFVGGGLYRPERQDLLAVRTRLSSEHRAFQSLVSRPVFRRMFRELSGEQLQRVPRGFPSDHPAADLLRHKQFLARRNLDSRVAQTPDFTGEVIRTFRALLPICRFLNDAILARPPAMDLHDGKDPHPR